MERELKKSYRLLNLPFEATEEEVNIRKNAMLKVIETENHKKRDYDILSIQQASENILNNIKKNGIPKEKDYYFEASTSSIVCLFIVLFFVAVICGVTIFVL